MPSRTYDWTDVDPTQDFLAKMSGLEYCRAIVAGTYPLSPIFRTLNIAVESVEPGSAVLFIEPQPYLMHGRGILNGGTIATLLDNAMAWAALTVLEQGSGFTTAHLGVDFLRPAPAGAGKLRAEGRVTNRGRKTILLEAKATNMAGKLVASATSTCLILDLATKEG